MTDMSDKRTTPRQANLVVESGSPDSTMEQLIRYVELNHGVAIVDFYTSSGRYIRLNICVARDDPNSHATLNQWSKH